MRSLTLKQIADLLAIQTPIPLSNHLVTGYCVDSRNVKPGDIFFALPGARSDGHVFIEEIKSKGAIAAVVHQDYAGKFDDFCLLYVEDTLQALQKLAKSLLELSKARIIAITGSYGKTTTKEFIHVLLADSYQVAVSPGNSNSQIGLPLAILNHTTGHEEIIILEMGMTHAGQISKLIQIAAPEVAVLTSVGLAHSENFDSIEMIACAKSEIFGHAQTRLGILHRDIPDYEKITKSTPCLKHSFSLTTQNADYTQNHLNPLKLYSQLDHSSIKIDNFKLPGKHNQHNLLAAIAVARYFNVSCEEIEKRLEKLFLPEKRLQYQWLQDILFINDSYNASEMTVKAALESLPKPEKGGRKIAVLGSLLELGKFTKECHQRVGEYALNFVDECYCFGKECQPIVDLWLEKKRPTQLFEDFSLLLAHLKGHLQPNDSVLIKGSRSKEMWRILEAFQDQTYTQSS